MTKRRDATSVYFCLSDFASASPFAQPEMENRKKYEKRNIDLMKEQPKTKIAAWELEQKEKKQAIFLEKYRGRQLMSWKKDKFQII